MKLLCVSQDEAINTKVRAESDRLNWSTVVVDRKALGQALRQYDPDMLLVEVEGLNDLNWWIDANLTPIKPVIFLNTELSEDFLASALDAGADAFLPKTLFSSRHFEARIKSLLRRQQQLGVAKRYVARLNMTIDSEHYTAEVDDNILNLTLTEFKILRELACEDVRVVSRAEIQSRVFGEAKLSTRSLDVHVCSLRKKIKPVSLDVDSVRGVGYRLSPCRK